MIVERFKIHHDARNVIKIVLVYLVINFVLYLMQFPLHSLMSNYTSLTYSPNHEMLKSEYHIGEQLSKFYLYVIILISIFIYKVSLDSSKIKLSISFLALSFVMYLSESNIIPEKAQPIFGVLGISFTSYFLFKLRSWLGLSSFLFGILLISLGFLSDLVHENQFVNSILPEITFKILNFSTEENYDLFGIAFILLSVILCFRIEVLKFLENELNLAIFILMSSGFMTIGNGFIHHQYQPNTILYSFALVMSIIGFLGQVYFTTKIKFTILKIRIVTKEIVYLCIFFFFVMLPAVHGIARTASALFLWLPSILSVAILMWRIHPINSPSVSCQE